VFSVIACGGEANGVLYYTTFGWRLKSRLRSVPPGVGLRRRQNRPHSGMSAAGPHDATSVAADFA